MAVEVGKKAPAFTMKTDCDGEVSLKTLGGKKVVLYFYPKDDTSGCTMQAIGFSEQLQAFKKAGAVVIGTSPDSVVKHDKFKAKHNLSVTLASDEEKKICEKYGVWIEKSMYGRKYMGVNRSTFLIDGNGKVARIWSKVKVPGHVEEVLEAVKAL